MSRGLPLLWVLALLILSPGCGTDRTVTEASERFACTTSGDCVLGYSCACGFCQPSAKATRCLADAGAPDAGAPDAGTPDAGTPDAGTPDAGTPDAAGGPCNVATWNGCPVGQGCYWDDTINKAVCLSHGKLGLDAACDPTLLTPCGITAQGEPLLCDATDFKCLRLCGDSTSSCPANLQCYILQDINNKDWPDSAGVCAPK